MNSLANMPNAFEESQVDYKLNEAIQIFDGIFVLKTAGLKAKVSGKISFEWLPSIHVKIMGVPESNGNDILAFFLSSEVSLLIKGKVICDIVIFSLENNVLLGKLTGKKHFGNTRRLVDRLTFLVPNMKDIPGTYVRWKNNGMDSNRLALTNDDFTINLEQCQNYKSTQKALTNAGGFAIQYYGEAVKKTGQFRFSEVEDLGECLNYFLSFINGRRTAIMCIKGIADDKIVWQDYTNYTVDHYKTVSSWYHKGKVLDINTLWSAFYSIWKDAEQKFNLRNVISWYLESNCNKVFIENCIILCQAAYELLYNWKFVEKNKGKETDSALLKIKSLVSAMQVDAKIPSTLKSLQNFEKIEFIDKKDKLFSIHDGPEIILEIRNALVHGNKWRRLNLSRIDTSARVDVWILSNWYLELFILFVLDYQGFYNNRSISVHKGYSAIELVPWGIP